MTVGNEMVLEANAERLKIALRDIFALSAIPAAWVGREPAAIASGLADVLVNALGLDFAFVRLCDPDGRSDVEAARGRPWPEFQEWLRRYFAKGGCLPRWEIIGDIGDDMQRSRGIVIPLGVNAESGLIAAACNRAWFPDEVDQLVLSVAANHTSTACRTARLMDDHARAGAALRESERQLREGRDELEKKVAERAAELQRSEAHLAEAQRLTRTGSWARDGVTGKDVYWSQEMFRIYGFDPQKGVPSPVETMERVHPEDRGKLKAATDKLTIERLDSDYEHRIVLPDGALKYVHTLAHPIINADVQLVEVFGTTIDITERKRAEEELGTLAEQRALLESSMNQSHEAAYLVDSGARFLYVNDEACRSIGCSREELLEMCVPDIDPDYPVERCTSIFQHVREKGPVNFETHHRRKDGRTFPVEITGSAVNYLGQHYFLALARNITERKRAEEAIRRNEAYLAEAQRLTRTGSWAWDPRLDRMLHCSEEIFRIYGLDRRDGAPSHELLSQRIHPEDRDWVRESTLEGARKKEERFLEYRILLPDGTLKYVESVRRPVLNAAGEIVEIVGTSIDVTGRKRDERERERLRKMEADLAHINRISMLGELTASLAHEIKQPIAGVITSANACMRWLAADPPDLERARASVTRIERDGARAVAVFDHLRSFYKKGGLEQQEPVDANDVIREMTALLHGECAQAWVTLRLELADGLPKPLADRVQLQQILMNLVLNAIEAMKDTGGILRVRSELQADGQLLISICDTGVGFPAEDAERMFDSFYTTKPKGTGMGLAITRSLVEAHGGRVWAAANAGSGATFSFTLPVQAEAQP